LVKPLLATLTSAVVKKLKRLIQTEKKFEGFTAEYVEKPFWFIRDNLYINGKIDRVSQNGEEIVVLDYKTSTSGYSRGKSAVDEDGSLEYFQIPMYIKLFEENTGEKVTGAYYFGINQNKLLPIVEDVITEKKVPTRDGYQPTLDAFDEKIARFAGAVPSLDFTIKDTKFATCSKCDYRTICRQTYSLNSGGRRWIQMSDEDGDEGGYDE